MTSLLLAALLATPTADAGCKTELAAAGTQIVTMQGELAAANERIAQLEAQVAELEAKANPPTAVQEQEARDLQTAAMELALAGDTEGAKAKLQQVLDDYGRTRVASRVTRDLRELQVVGTRPLSDWKSHTKDTFGVPDVDLEDGVVLAVFFEAWCPHCRREVPNLTATNDKYPDLQVVGFTRITKSSTAEKVEEMWSENNVSYPAVHEDGQIAEAFSVTGIPAAAILVDGEVVWRGHPGRITDEMLTNYLGQ